MSARTEDKPRDEVREAFAQFDALHRDDWSAIVLQGIPLCAKLKKLRDPRTRGVESRLRELRDTLKNSGAGSDEEKRKMIAAIEKVLHN
jgi:hypothetical protein